MKKFLIPVLFALVLIGAGFALWALASNAGDTGQSAGVGHPERPPDVGTVALPPINAAPTTTTTATPVPTTLPPVRTTAPTNAQPKIVVPVVATTTTVPVVVKTVVATTTTTTAPSVSVQVVTTGTLTAPDGLGCSAGTDQECVLVKVIPVNGNLSSFVVIDAGGNVAGVFNTEFESQPYCLIHWLIKSPIGTVASSSNCSGGPVESTQTTLDFTYSYLS